jgi:hypothetical protein
MPDKGWDVAQIAYGLLPQLRIYLILDPNILKASWYSSIWTGTETPSGIVFGWDATPKSALNKEETGNLQTVLAAITKARS